MCVVVIPAYEPNNNLVELVKTLSFQGYGVLVIDDGSGEKFRNVFEKVSLYPNTFVIANECNMGKGATLKHGISRIREFFPECKIFVTADADGQHRVKDIDKVRAELESNARMVLTVRIRKGKIPFRSRFGNDLSKFVYTILTGHYFTDNQSGLRGFRIEDAEWLTRVRGSKYDYELNVLFYADKQMIPITTIPIDAIYIDDNKDSHFSPVRDTILIYRRLFSTAWPSFAAVITWGAIMLIVSFFLKYNLFFLHIPGFGVICTFISVIFYRFIVLRRFKYRDGLRSIIYALFRYSLYTAGVAILHFLFGWLPLFVALAIIVAALLPVEYYFRKGMHVAQYKDINKEG